MPDRVHHVWPPIARARWAAMVPVLLLAAGCATGPSRPPGAADACGASGYVLAPVTLREWGEYEPEAAERRVDAPLTTTGYVHQIGALEVPRLKERTDRVPARVGVRFGVRFVVERGTLDDITELRTRVLHPPMQNPATGQTTEREEWPAPANGRLPRFTGWRFEHPWEVVPGRWVIQLLDCGRVVAEKAFSVE